MCLFEVDLGIEMIINLRLLMNLGVVLVAYRVVSQSVGSACDESETRLESNRANDYQNQKRHQKSGSHIEAAIDLHKYQRTIFNLALRLLPLQMSVFIVINPLNFFMIVINC